MKIDLFNRLWIDLIFEGRNKSYGGYELRKSNGRITVIALILGGFIFSTALATPLIIKYIKSQSEAAIDENNRLDDKIVIMNLPPPPKDETPPPPPPKIDPTKSVKDVKKFIKPEVVKKEDVTEEIAKVEDLKKANVGREDIKGDPTLGEIKIDEPIGEADKGEEITEDNGVYNMAGIQVQPSYPGGMEAFGKLIRDNFDVEDIGASVSGRIYVQFVVEKDGSITDIKVLRDLGYGTGKEAIRVLKLAKKWNPGVQNGRPVRVLYSLPIIITTQ